MSGGSIHAALLPGSEDAAQTLSGHLAGLNAYLAEQHTPVETLTLAAASGGGIETNTGQNMQQGTSPDAERNTPAQSQTTLQPGTATGPAAAARGTEVESCKFDAIAYVGEMRGRHISVMA
jgi:hypothetical protein